MGDPVTAALIVGALSAGTQAVTSHQQNVSQKRVAREGAARQRELETNRRRIDVAAQERAKDQETQMNKVASSRVRQKQGQLLDLKGIQRRGSSPAPSGFSGITQNVLQENS